jgi:nucleoside-diphosphate-sugar epimerase
VVARNLVIGVSGGIGGAVAAALAARGEAVTGLSRSRDGLDVTDEASVARVLGALDAPFQRVIVATGALEIAGTGPEKSLRAVNPAALAAQFALNAAGPVLVLKHALRLMPRDAPARFAALSARVVHTAAIEIARTHRQAVVVCLHPGTVATAFGAAQRGSHPALAPEESAGHLLAVLDRLSPADTGGFFDWQGARVPW